MKKNKKKIVKMMLVLSIFLLSTISVSATNIGEEKNLDKKNLENNPKEINPEDAGKIYGFVKWGSNHPYYVNEGDPIKDCIIEAECVRFIFLIWDESGKTNESGYYEIKNVPIGETYRNGEPWEFSVGVHVVVKEGFITSTYRGFNGPFTMSAEGEPVVQKDFSTDSVGVEGYSPIRFGFFEQIRKFFSVNKTKFV